jgi:repressor LexA
MFVAMVMVAFLLLREPDFGALMVVMKGARGELLPISLEREVKILGYVEAGFPSAVEEIELDTKAVSDLILKDKKNVFLLNVKGESMIDAGIHDGDMVLVEKCNDARVGSIVIANIDGEWTMKYLREKKGKEKANGRYLEAANEAYPDLIPTQSLSIAGVVISVIRTYI